LLLLGASANGLATETTSSIASIASTEPMAPGTLDEHAAPSQQVTLHMRDADIRAVVHWLGNVTGKRFVIDPRVKGKMTVYAKTPLSVEQAYQVIVEALQVNGVATVDSGDIVRIVPDALAKSQPTTFSEVLDDSSTDPAMTTYVLPLTNIPATELVRQLKPLIPPAGYITAVNPSTLMVVDNPKNIKRIARLAEYIDQQGAMAFEVYPLAHAPASAARDILDSLATDGSTAQGVAVDQRSNSLLLSGTVSQRRQWRQLLQSLDRPHSTNGSTRVFYLHYLNASELLPVLRGMTNNIQQQVNSADTNIEALESANAIIANGSPYFLDEIASVIEKTDFRRAQVLVDAIIVEVSDDFAREIGVQWKSSFGDGVAAASQFGGVKLSDAGKVLLGRGLSLGFLQGGDLRFLLNAIATQVDANILSQPSIVTLDNEAAEILVGQNIPLLTGQSTGSASSTNNPFTTVERKDIGITLKVTPQINEGDAITLDVLQEVENVSATASLEATDLVTNKRSVKTKVLVKDQEILVLGGLIDTTDQETIRKVPLLGDIPVLGTLFRSKKVEQLRRNLMVFIRPTILQDADDNHTLSRERYQRIRDRQQTSQHQYNSSYKRDSIVLPEYDTIVPAP
jgi:general secretion pathway protein D